MTGLMTAKFMRDTNFNKPTKLRAESNVRMLDGQAVIVVQWCDDGNAMVVYEDDRTNTRWCVCQDWLK